jgi:hypothetical protein
VKTKSIAECFANRPIERYHNEVSKTDTLSSKFYLFITCIYYLLGILPLFIVTNLAASRAVLGGIEGSSELVVQITLTQNWKKVLI